MTASMNKVILMGNLGKNPETRTLESGIVMCRFPIATSEILYGQVITLKEILVKSITTL